MEVDGDAAAALTVVFSHGFTARLAEWELQRAALRERARLVLWDQRGHGRSGWTRLTAATIDRTGHDLGRGARRDHPDRPGGPGRPLDGRHERHGARAAATGAVRPPRRRRLPARHLGRRAGRDRAGRPRRDGGAPARSARRCTCGSSSWSRPCWSGSAVGARRSGAGSPAGCCSAPTTPTRPPCAWCSSCSRRPHGRWRWPSTRPSSTTTRRRRSRCCAGFRSPSSPRPTTGSPRRRTAGAWRRPSATNAELVVVPGAGHSVNLTRTEVVDRALLDLLDRAEESWRRAG